MVEVEFTKAFATKKKGDIAAYDSMMARRLIDRKVARYYVKKPEKKDE